MEVSLRDAKARLSELIAAVENGEKVIITKHGKRVVEMVTVNHNPNADFFARLKQAKLAIGLSEEAAPWPQEFDDPAFSRKVLQLDDDD